MAGVSINSSENTPDPLTPEQQTELANWQAYQATISQAPSGTLNPANYGTADSEAAAVAQAQYNEWKTTYLPAAQAELAQTTYANPSIVGTDVQQAIGNVNQAFDTTAGTQQRFNSEYGITPTAGMSAVNSRVNNNSRSLSVVQAAQNIRANLVAQNSQIMEGGISNFQPTGT